FSSATVKRYLSGLGIQGYSVSKKTVKGYAKKPNLFEALRPAFEKEIGDKPYPIRVGIHFVRGTKHKCDFHNIVQIIADLMVAHDFIEDDNMDCFIPVPLKIKGNYYSHDPEEPGVWIKIY